tara:strand:+ start:331 stop:498 length:168 start_codon:yes stop_codon:yes gene_type:complete
VGKVKRSENKGAGKGDKPRGGFSRSYRDNYDVINWGDHDKCVNAQNAKKISKKQN